MRCTSAWASRVQRGHVAKQRHTRERERRRRRRRSDRAGGPAIDDDDDERKREREGARTRTTLPVAPLRSARGARGLRVSCEPTVISPHLYAERERAAPHLWVSGRNHMETVGKCKVERLRRFQYHKPFAAAITGGQFLVSHWCLRANDDTTGCSATARRTVPCPCVVVHPGRRLMVGGGKRGPGASKGPALDICLSPATSSSSGDDPRPGGRVRRDRRLQSVIHSREDSPTVQLQVPPPAHQQPSPSIMEELFNTFFPDIQQQSDAAVASTSSTAGAGMMTLVAPLYLL